MSKSGYRGVSLPDAVYDELVMLGQSIATDVGISPLSVPEVIIYLKNKHKDTKGLNDEATKIAR